VVDTGQVHIAVNAASEHQGQVEVVVRDGGEQQSVGAAWVAQQGSLTILTVPTVQASEILFADMLGIDKLVPR